MNDELQSNQAAPGTPSGYDYLIQLRDGQRQRVANAINVVKMKDLPWELNPQGKMCWYMHPTMEHVSLKTFLMYLQEIPPGSRSGKQHHQGGVLIHILKGQGCTVIDGVRHHWEDDDCVMLPMRPQGIDYQHFNTNPNEPALLLACEPNLTDVLGVDRGAGFEQLEAAPEYLDVHRA
jgi:gentisate 1,2-dioxygenase